ncbi:hypothetical protein F5148DRAFT_1369529 [Russula earlei]|uniref:Uncharacterized protein n=1 Tax=Russula earlei TaxID=71964 RepID=A0ACC0U1I0_9AGAM|nr:hypothetical protein F5148DRAFT_1369529 [Russula earlei]
MYKWKGFERNSKTTSAEASDEILGPLRVVLDLSSEGASIAGILPVRAVEAAGGGGVVQGGKGVERGRQEHRQLIHNTRSLLVVGEVQRILHGAGSVLSMLGDFMKPTAVKMCRSLLLCAARSSTTICGPSRVSLKQWSLDRVTINTLPDDALLEIFDFYVNHLTGTNEWHRLVHVANIVTPLPDSFLGGSAPLLRHLSLDNCPFPGISKLLWSSKQLVELYLYNIPDSDYISPQDLVTALSVLSRLEALYLGFRSPLYPASRPPPPLTRSVLPALRELAFKGVHEYLEDLSAQIEAPLLTRLIIIFFMDIDFVVPQLHRLISQAESFNSCDKATVRTSNSAIEFAIFRKSPLFPDLSLLICCRELDRQPASLAQLDITCYAPQSHWKYDMETAQWLELLAPFTAMKDLRLTHQVAPHVCQALEELVGERVTEVLPALQNIFLVGLEPLESVPKYMERFVAARKLSAHPVAVHRWE